MGKVLVLGLVLLASHVTWAYKPRAYCSQHELKLKDCAIETFGYKLHFFEDKIIMSNGIWRSIEEIPVKGKNLEWARAHVQRLGERVFINFQAWSDPKGPAEVQSLKWAVFELKGIKLHKLLERVVQKRLRDFDAKEPKYFLDKKDHFGLKITKGKVYWYHSGEQKPL